MMGIQCFAFLLKCHTENRLQSLALFGMKGAITQTKAVKTMSENKLFYRDHGMVTMAGSLSTMNLITLCWFLSKDEGLVFKGNEQEAFVHPIDEKTESVA